MTNCCPFASTSSWHKTLSLKRIRCNRVCNIAGQTLWLHHNNMVFNEKFWDADQVFDLVKFRVNSWAKAKRPTISSSIKNMIQDPSTSRVPTTLKSAKIACDWVKPPMCFLQFNVDGATKGCPGEATIGRALRNCNDNVRILFSKSLGISDSNLSKIKVIKEAFALFAASPWSLSHSLIIESDSTKAIKWCNIPDSVTWHLRGILNHINCFKKKLQIGLLSMSRVQETN
ncbi:Uncharacterized protein TCM_002089 [Theobroma cacao]|uniref:RNase H type-1 domain-containing protein n=1 Tax=Theobroma cacao TaxID=3641 RepID=A0A061DKG7_THECC|nr:Uncharacterized protein TCM_002089 [Theobroma cacao]